jgi:hypothetical protein
MIEAAGLDMRRQIDVTRKFDGHGSPPQPKRIRQLACRPF